MPLLTPCLLGFAATNLSPLSLCIQPTSHPAFHSAVQIRFHLFIDKEILGHSGKDLANVRVPPDPSQGLRGSHPACVMWILLLTPNFEDGYHVCLFFQASEKKPQSFEDDKQQPCKDTRQLPLVSSVQPHELGISGTQVA